MNKILKKIISGTVLCTMSIYTLPIFAFANEETIYSKLDTNGKSYKNIVSIRENDESDVIQKDTDKELPIQCNVTYTLDGKEITAEELAGKSGKVTIRIEYTNTSFEEVTINGKKETMYTPFAVISGTIIDGDNNKNVEIENGKIIKNGSKVIAIGISMPGMQESLDLDKNDVEIPNYIEIKMDSTNFELGNIISYTTPKVLDEDIDFSKLDDLYSDINDLEDASKELQDGTITLQDGVVQFKDGTTELNNGAIKFRDSANLYVEKSNELNKGIQKLSAGIKESKNDTSTAKQLNDLINGAKAVSDGVGSIYNGLDQTQSGMGQLKTGVDNLSTATKAVQASVSTANQIVNSIDSINVTVSNDQEALKAYNTQIITGNSNSIALLQSTISTLQTTIDGLNTQKAALSQETDAQAIATIDATIAQCSGQIGALNSEIAQLDGINKGLMDLSNNQQVVSTTKTIDNSEALNTLKGNLTAANSGLSGLSKGLESVDSGITKLSEGTNQMLASKEALTTGALQVSGGTQIVAQKLNDTLTTLDTNVSYLADKNTQLNDAAGKLGNGASDLVNGTSKLDSKTNDLLDGTNKLVDGVETFNRDGIGKITDLVNVDLKNMQNRISLLEDMSKKYNTYESDEQRDAIKFISMINSIKNSSKEETNEEMILTNTNTNVVEEKK